MKRFPFFMLGGNGEKSVKHLTWYYQEYVETVNMELYHVQLLEKIFYTLYYPTLMMMQEVFFSENIDLRDEVIKKLIFTAMKWIFTRLALTRT